MYVIQTPNRERDYHILTSWLRGRSQLQVAGVQASIAGQQSSLVSAKGSLSVLGCIL